MPELSQLGDRPARRPRRARGARGGDRERRRGGSAEGLVVTQDALVEGVHFRLDWLSWRDLGWRTAAINLSDLAASGAGTSPDRDPRRAAGNLAGRHSRAVRGNRRRVCPCGAAIRRGRTTSCSRSPRSRRSERIPGRTGARPGDRLVVTSTLGAAGAAFRHNTYVRPPLRLEEGRALAEHAHAMLDVSDGLAVDAGHIAGGRRALRDRPRAGAAGRERRVLRRQLRRGFRAARRGRS